VDPVVIPLLVFWVIIASIVGGVILLRPVSRRLGHFPGRNWKARVSNPRNCQHASLLWKKDNTVFGSTKSSWSH